jgi:putative intracellular protease/amidase
MKNFILILILIIFSRSIQAIEANKILMVASNVNDMGDPEKHDARNNLWEYAPAYHVFVSHGYEVDFVSPYGGQIPFMMDPIGISSYTIKYEGFLDKANNSLRPEELNPNNYSAVYIGGGYGNLFDVATDEKILRLIANIYEQGGIVGSCGHGAGGFANVKLSDGNYLIKDKKIAGFPNSTELQKSWAKKGALLPFFVETKLSQNGAIVINKQSVPDKHAVITDQRIVTSMFLPSAAIVAKEILNLLNKK